MTTTEVLEGGEDDPWQRIELLPVFETHVLMNAPPLCTVTIYSGDPPMAWLRERVAQILQVNPWLAGRLKKDKAHGIHLAYPLKPADIDTVVVQIEDDIGLRMGMSYPDFSKKVLDGRNGLILETGSRQINRWAPQYNLSIRGLGSIT